MTAGWRSYCLGVVAIAAVLLLAAPPAKAQDCTMTVSPSSGPIGTRVVISGEHWSAPGPPVSLSFEGLPGRGTAGKADIGTLTPGSDGTFTTTFVIPTQLDNDQPVPNATAAGVYEFATHPASCVVGFTVTSTSASGRAASLAFTGDRTARCAALGIALLLSGALLLKATHY